MSRLAVYLEIGDDGRCMAHVPELPGCFVRASSRDRAWELVPATIRNHYAWLRCHGEPAPPEEAPFGIKIAGEVSGVGPFDPGSTAALFPPDQGGDRAGGDGALLSPDGALPRRSAGPGARPAGRGAGLASGRHF